MHYRPVRLVDMLRIHFYIAVLELHYAASLRHAKRAAWRHACSRWWTLVLNTVLGGWSLGARLADCAASALESLGYAARF